ncbi:hypothetical protein [Sedimentibacter sp.]|uniref:hypothetical protein n=1 Tax=Sedimentibacter sp. TaxID=1960295 RepID=UPI00289E7778|nr:hypothetical protein [Sedimentibacter sp.]
MVDKLKKVVFIILALIGFITIISYSIGYRLVIESRLIPDWNAIETIIQVMIAIATLLAVYVAIEPSKIKLSVNFYMLYNSYANLSLASSNPKLLITNVCNRTVVLNSIAILHGNTNHININLFSDQVERPFILKINDKDFDKPQPIVINPGQTVVIEFSVVGLNYIFGHFCDPPSGKEELDLMFIRITESFGKTIKFNTNITYKQYYNNLVKIINELYNYN